MRSAPTAQSKPRTPIARTRTRHGEEAHRRSAYCHRRPRSLIWIPTALADTNDDAYLNAMAAHHIHSIGGPADLIYAGHQVCGFLSPDQPAMVTDYVVRASVNTGRFYTIWGNSHNPITSSQAGMLVQYAIGTYCPNSPGAVHRAPAGHYFSPCERWTHTEDTLESAPCILVD